MKYSIKKNAFGENLVKVRKSKNVSQAELAEKLNIDRSLISYYENGAREPKLGTVELIAEALGVGIEELLVESDSSSTGEMKLTFKQPTILENGDKIYTPEDLTDDDLYFIKKLHEADETTKEIIKKILGT